MSSNPQVAAQAASITDEYRFLPSLHYHTVQEETHGNCHLSRMLSAISRLLNLPRLTNTTGKPMRPRSLETVNKTISVGAVSSERKVRIVEMFVKL